MSTLKKILMVDDDADLREALADQLVLTEEFDVFEAGDGADGLVRAKEQNYDLVILDVGLPDMDGRELCRLMRKQGVKCPVIMLTGHGTDSDTILGLDAGANDYVAKPFKFPVLLARIRAVLRRTAAAAEPTAHATTIVVEGHRWDRISAYDAGTCYNDEACASIPGPFVEECGGPGGGAP